jgi:oligosaccharide reducing-end xylanase
VDTRNGHNRNLFSQSLGKLDEEIDDKLAAGFKQLFHGNDVQRIYYESGEGAYILDANSGDVRSEGMSYGMMIAVQMDKKAEFNKIWAWAKRSMRQPSGMYGWQANADGSLRSTGSAPDGEEYFATALIFAGKRWRDNTLLDEGKRICQAMVSSGAFDRKNNLVKFLTDVDYTNPSYVLPAFYEVWADADRDNEAFWKEAANHGRNFFPKTCNSTTMLAPYLANFDGSGYGVDGIFRNDAWRVVGNIMMDWNFFGVDPWQKDVFAPQFAAFMKSAMAAPPYPSEMHLNGVIITSHSDPCKGLVAQNALVGFGLPASDGAYFVKDLWNMEIPSGQYRYYDGCLYLLALLHASGRFCLYV